MIATILPSSPTFHAVAYNVNKIAQGSARLLEIKNFGSIDTFGYSSADELTRYLIEYSSRNDRIKQPQFHLAISCKGHEYSEEELVEFAHKYLEEMGYGDPEQPLLIFGHRDTDNTHIHVITSRVDPNGRKINDSNERRRSQKVIDKILRKDKKVAAEKDIKNAFQFNFRNVNQFKAIFEAMNYECFEVDGKMCVKKGGMVQVRIDIEDIKKKAERNKLCHKNDTAENARWRAIFKKYRDTNTSRIGLEKDLKKLFGISLVFFGKKDSPYGYQVIDFNNKKVLEGGNILGVKELLEFATPEEHMNEIEEFINHAFDQNPHITTKELNKKLRRLGAYVRKDSVIFGKIKKVMAEGHRAILERNNKIEWRNGFKPQNEKERDLICKLTGFQYPDLIRITKDPNGKYNCKDYDEISNIFKISSIKQRLESFETSGFRIIIDQNDVFVFRQETQTLIDLSKAGFEKEQYAPLIPSNNEKNTQTIPNSTPDRTDKRRHADTTSRDGSKYENREWEVGKKGQDSDDMDRAERMSY